MNLKEPMLINQITYLQADDAAPKTSYYDLGFQSQEVAYNRDRA